MKPLNKGQLSILSELSKVYYRIIPRDYLTYCSLTAEISVSVLQHFGIAAHLVPCQVWLAGPDKNLIVGFTQVKMPGKWDGHVVCVAQDWLIDAATHHFKKDFGVDVPDLILARRFPISSSAISRYDLDQNTRLWWLNPPPAADTRLPPSASEVVKNMSQMLIRELMTIGPD